jgi:hypothetical protein
VSVACRQELDLFAAHRVPALVLAMALAVLPAAALAQSTTSRADTRVYRTTGTRIAIARDLHVAHDEEIRDAVAVVGGSLRVDGLVRDGIVVVGGNLELGPEAHVGGDIVLVGGGLTRAEGSRISGSVSDIGLGAWKDWGISVRSWPWIELGEAGRWLGLLAAMVRVALLALFAGAVLLVARARVARVAGAAVAEPGRAMLIGLAAELLFLPVLIIGSIALALTIIGIPLLALLLPLTLVASLVALLMGFTALACRVGQWIEDRLGLRFHSLVAATALGLLVIVGPSLLSRAIGVAPEPVRDAAFGLLVAGAVIEFVVWTIGLGATLMTGFGRGTAAPPPLPTVL